MNDQFDSYYEKDINDEDTDEHYTDVEYSDTEDGC